MLHKLRKFILPENDIIKFIENNARVLDIGCGSGAKFENISEFLKQKKI